MIVAKLIGGLGNQFFQYAAGFALARRLKTELLIDTSEFNVYKLHKLAIDHFNITARFLTTDEQKSLEKYRGKRKSRLFFPKRIFEYEENGLQFNPEFKRLKGNVFLNGYWQTEKYFDSIQEEIRREFSIRSTLNEQDRTILNSISNCESVALHIRRGDYVSNPHTQTIHGLCSLPYYYRSLDKLLEVTPIDRVFVFSDDPDWVKSNLKVSIETVYVDHNDSERNFADLHLMSKAKHIITANSSFSWWASWLNDNPRKKVIMPMPWFKESGMNTPDKYFNGVLTVDASD